MTAAKPNETFRLEINEPVLVKFDTLGRRMKMFLVDLAEGGCRMRATACVPNDRISFEWTGPSQNAIAIYGSIAEAKLSGKLPEFSVHFEMPLVERDKLASELAEVQRRVAFKPVETKSEGGSTKRQAYRAPVKFPVTVKVPGRGKELPGEANDLSIGGLLLNTKEDFEEGTIVEIDFELPLDDVELETKVQEVVEKTPFGPRAVKKNVLLHPFEPFAVKLKIVKRVGTSPTGYAFGGAFYQMSAFNQEEIARYVHAYQLTQLRKAAKLEK
jgi:hypothetical protein